MDQLRLFDRETQPAEPPAPPLWLGFSPDHDPADALATYRARYGVEPQQAVRTLGGVLLVGPLGPGQVAGATLHREEALP